MTGGTGGIQNENAASQNNYDNCCENMAAVGRNVKYVLRFAAISALAMSIVAVVILRKDEATLPRNNEELRSLRQKITPCLTNGTYPIFLRRIFQLTSKIEGIKTNLTQIITEMESSLENNVTNVEASLNKRLIVLQSQVSDLKTNTNKLQTNFGTFRDLTNSKFTQIWEKFDEVEAAIAKKRG